jgi:uncharacterized membrane protein YgcG
VGMNYRLAKILTHEASACLGVGRSQSAGWRTFSWFVVCAVAVAALAVGLAMPAGAQSYPEKIVSYDVGIVIQHDGSLLVNERIVYDFGTDARHGIFREIPVRFGYNADYDRVYQLAVRSVRSPDAPAQYEVNRTGSSVLIKIGDPGQLVTGRHTYELTYLVRGALNAFADHDELYWNALGTRWDVPIGQAVVRVTAPGAVTRAVCFAGPPGSAQPCMRASIANRVASFTQSGLGPREGFTVVVALPLGLMPPPRPLLVTRWSLERAFSPSPVSLGTAGALLALLAIAAAVIMVRGRGRRFVRLAAPANKRTSVRAGVMEPPAARTGPVVGHGLPEDLRPAQAGVLLHGAVRARDFTGTVVDLAMRGYLRIDQVEGLGRRARPEWRLVRSTKTGDLHLYEQILLKGLFQEAASPRLSQLGPAFGPALSQARDALYEDVTERGWFTSRPDQVRRRWRALGVIMTVVGAVVMAVIAGSGLALAPVPVTLAGLALTGCARWMPVRTPTGAELASRVRRFRDVIVAPSAQHNELTRRPGVLYGCLPYAIVFGCAKEWAGMTASLTTTGQAPAWHVNGGEFPADCLNSLPHSSYYFSFLFSGVSRVQNLATLTGDAIANSGWSSGGSGFGGGGSAGGGGGGGGGGSW